MPLHRKARTTLTREVRASWPLLTGTNPHRATVPVVESQELRKVALAQCGHAIPLEAKLLYEAWEPELWTYPDWWCPICEGWVLVNVYPDHMEIPPLF